MIQKLPMFILPICALLLYADAMPKLTKSSSLTSRKRTSAMAPDEVTKMFDKPTKPSKKVAKKTVEVTGASSGHHADNVRPKVNIGQHVEQPGTPQIEEHAHAVASTSESMDPKSQLEELLEMNEALMWEMAVRSEDEQITMSVRPEDLLIADLEDEPITDLEDEPITNLENEPITDLEVEQIIEEIQLEDELITDLEDDTEDDDLLQWFPTFIFMKLEKFLPNVPQGDGQHKAELTKLVESWKAETEQTAQIEQIEDSLDTYRWELRNRIMPGVKLTSPVVKLLVAQGINNSHAEEKKAFLSKMPTSYANKFFGGIEIATAYLKQAVEIGQWAQNNHFLTTAQLENLPKLVEQNLSELANLREAMATKLDIDLAKLDIDLTKDIDLAKIEMPELMAQSLPLLDNIFTSNLSEKHAETKGIAQREETKINDAQIAALHLLVALSAASAEVAALEAELLGIKITWRAFQTVGDVSKMAQILRQI
ncbi:hypothetical protein GPALN_004071 [Globodera pallida]|nr:hypothetical protein GPALN_004071 [Globodera pallida]